MELNNDLQAEPEFKNVKRVRHMKRHFHYVDQDEPIKKIQKKFEIQFSPVTQYCFYIN
jgi:hypothetical protein